jgi:hypothetical protein
LLSATVRVHGGFEALAASLPRNRRVIFCMWHNRLFLSAKLYRKFARRTSRDCRLAAMVSASRDGGVLAWMLTLMGIQPVRGSTSRRGPQALLELTSWAERGYDLAITPDGPRGPRYRFQAGAVYLAQLTGLPLAPISFRLTPKWCLRSWDRFQIPLPFARCEVRLGELVNVPRQASAEDRESIRLLLEQRLAAITKDD